MEKEKFKLKSKSNVSRDEIARLKKQVYPLFVRLAKIYSPIQRQEHEFEIEGLTLSVFKNNDNNTNESTKNESKKNEEKDSLAQDAVSTAILKIIV